MRFDVIGGVLSLLLSNVCLLPAAMAQGELKTPNCIDPQEQMERVCCGSPSPQVCQAVGYTAPGQDQNTQESSIPPLNEIQVLAPWGATIGMQVSELDTILKARGLRGGGGGCQWMTYQSQDVSIGISVSLMSAAGTPSQKCVEDLPVHTMSFQQNEGRKEVFSQLPLAAEMVETWIKRFGDPMYECRQGPTPGGSSARCSFENVSADIKRLDLNYDHNDNQFNRSVSFSANITGFDRNETAESAIGEEAGAASEDPKGVDAVLASHMSNPMQAPMVCQVIRMAISSGEDASLAGTTVVKKGELLADMPAECKN